MCLYKMDPGDTATLNLWKTSNKSVTEYWKIPSCVYYAEQLYL